MNAMRVVTTWVELGEYVRVVCRDHTRALTALVIATGFAVQVKRGSR